MVSASKKTFSSDIVKNIKNNVIGFPSFFVDEKDVDFDVNTADNANDDIPDNDFFVTIFICLSMIMTSSNYFYLF